MASRPTVARPAVSRLRRGSLSERFGRTINKPGRAVMRLAGALARPAAGRLTRGSSRTFGRTVKRSGRAVMRPGEPPPYESSLNSGRRIGRREGLRIEENEMRNHPVAALMRKSIVSSVVLAGLTSLSLLGHIEFGVGRDDDRRAKPSTPNVQIAASAAPAATGAPASNGPATISSRCARRPAARAATPITTRAGIETSQGGRAAPRPVEAPPRSPRPSRPGRPPRGGITYRAHVAVAKRPGRPGSHSARWSAR